MKHLLLFLFVVATACTTKQETQIIHIYQLKRASLHADSMYVEGELITNAIIDISDFGQNVTVTDSINTWNFHFHEDALFQHVDENLFYSISVPDTFYTDSCMCVSNVDRFRLGWIDGYFIGEISQTEVPNYSGHEIVYSE